MRTCRERSEELGLDPKRVESIARRISDAVKEANAMGLTLFAGNGSGVLVLKQRMDVERGEPDELVVAELDGEMDGGAGDHLNHFNN